jgi:hypothetical protein
MPAFEFRLNKPARDWVVYELNPNTRQHNVMDIYNIAIVQSVFRLYAKSQGLESFLASPEPNRMHRNLPPMPDYAPAVDDVTVRGARPSPVGWASLEWAVRHGATHEQVMDSGIRVLGALATMPAGSGIAIHDAKGLTYASVPRFNLAGIDPYPPEIGLPLVPPA